MYERFATALSIGILAASSPDFAFAQAETHSLEQILVESAETAADHTALAHHYRAKAASARAEAKRHEQMGRSYDQRKIREREAYRRHCEKISRSLNEQAASFDALAAMHETEAATAAE